MTCLRVAHSLTCRENMESKMKKMKNDSSDEILDLIVGGWPGVFALFLAIVFAVCALFAGFLVISIFTHICYVALIFFDHYFCSLDPVKELNAYFCQ